MAAPSPTKPTEAEASYPVLVDGVPEWLEPSLFRWVADRAATGGHGLARRAEQLLRIRLPNPSNREYQLVAYWRNATDTDRLTLIDFILAEWERLYDAAQRDFHGHDTAQEVVRAIDSMAGMLTDGGSLWRFETDPHWCLVRRVTEAAEQQYATATSPSSDAANRLKRAWTACYRQSPNYDEAYRNAVLAVEAVVLPVTIPNDTSGTLGKAVRNINDTRARWTVGGLTSEGPSGADALITMLDLLWKNTGATCPQRRHDCRRFWPRGRDRRGPGRGACSMVQRWARSPSVSAASPRLTAPSGSDWPTAHRGSDTASDIADRSGMPARGGMTHVVHPRGSLM